jgi:hypothetical protein
MAAELSHADLVPALCGAWANVLLYPEAGPDSDFLDCGGDSLTAMRLATLVSRLTGQDVRVNWIFECGTPAKLAAFLEARSPGDREAGKPDE